MKDGFNIWYFSSKTIIVLSIIVLLLIQIYSNYYYSITTKENGVVIVNHRSGIFYSVDNPGSSDENEIRNDVVCYLSQNVGDCKTLSFLTLVQTVVFTLLLLSFIPMFGEPVGLIGAILLLIYTIYVIVFMEANKQSAQDFAKDSANIPHHTQCNGNVCVSSSTGESFILNIILLILSLVVIGQSSYGIYALLNCT